MRKSRKINRLPEDLARLRIVRAELRAMGIEAGDALAVEAVRFARAKYRATKSNSTRSGARAPIVDDSPAAIVAAVVKHMAAEGSIDV